MEGITLHPVRVAGWAPPPYRPPRQVLAQASSTAARPVEAPAAARPPFIDSALVATVFDSLAAISAGILWYAASHPVAASPGGARPAPSKWSWVFGVLTITMTGKGILDLASIRNR